MIDICVGITLAVKEWIQKISDKQEKVLGKEDDIHSLVSNDTSAQGRAGIVGKGDSVAQGPDKLQPGVLIGRRGNHIIQYDTTISRAWKT